MKLSVGIITFNEEKDLPRTLASIQDLADEIVIVDSGSTDKTAEIAASFNARFFVETWKGFGLQKNSVIDKCSGKWILLIDADEEISPELRTEIKNVIAQEETPFEVYQLRFLSICFGKKIKHGGWSGFYRIRLFQNGAGRYDNKEVHEDFVSEKLIGKLKGEIFHYTYNDWNDYIEKFNSYTSKSAETMYKSGKQKPVFLIWLSSTFYFLKSYVFRLGFLDGYEGYLLSKFGAMTVLIKYVKLKALRQ